MAKYKMLRRDKTGPINEYLTIEGADILDAVKRNFTEILNASTYYSVPFRYPITVTPESDIGGNVRLKLTWMWATHRNKPETEHTHNIHINAPASEYPSTEPFVVLGN